MIVVHNWKAIETLDTFQQEFQQKAMLFNATPEGEHHQIRSAGRALTQFVMKGPTQLCGRVISNDGKFVKISVNQDWCEKGAVEMVITVEEWELLVFSESILPLERVHVEGAQPRECDGWYEVIGTHEGEFKYEKMTDDDGPKPEIYFTGARWCMIALEEETKEKDGERKYELVYSNDTLAGVWRGKRDNSECYITVEKAPEFQVEVHDGVRILSGGIDGVKILHFFLGSDTAEEMLGLNDKTIELLRRMLNMASVKTTGPGKPQGTFNYLEQLMNAVERTSRKFLRHAPDNGEPKPVNVEVSLKKILGDLYIKASPDQLKLIHSGVQFQTGSVQKYSAVRRAMTDFENAKDGQGHVVYDRQVFVLQIPGFMEINSPPEWENNESARASFFPPTGSPEIRLVPIRNVGQTQSLEVNLTRNLQQNLKELEEEGLEIWNPAVRLRHPWVVDNMKMKLDLHINFGWFTAKTDKGLLTIDVRGPKYVSLEGSGK